MNTRIFLTLLLLGGAVAAAYFSRDILHDGGDVPRPAQAGADRRVRFVCCDNHGGYSSGIYMRVGGGKAAFDTVREAAPFLRAGDPGSAAAGLCGFLFKRFDYDGETAGTLSVDPPPETGPDGKVDWEKYGKDGDIILINVDTGRAQCCFGLMVGQEITDLKLGGRAR